MASWIPQWTWKTVICHPEMGKSAKPEFTPGFSTRPRETTAQNDKFQSTVLWAQFQHHWKCSRIFLHGIFRYRSSIGFVWMVPYRCPSASQMLLPFLSNYTQALGSLFTQGTGASPRLVYPPLLLFTFCLTSASLPCYFSILALERKIKSFSAYLCQVIIPDFKTSRKHPLFFLFPQAEPQSSLPLDRKSVV